MITLKKGATPSHLQKLNTILSERRSAPKRRIKEYRGSILLKEDPMVVQKQIRDKWH